MKAARLAVTDLNKAFSVPVLKRLSLKVAPGEIHAIVGENGAGKTTLINILTGNLPRDSGDIQLDGSAYQPHGAADAFAAGVSSVAQELSTISTLSVAENIALRRLPHKKSVIRRKLLHRQARELLHRVGLEGIPPQMLAGDLSIAERQLLELARALSTDSRLLLLDEPTAALTAQQAQRVHEIVTQLAENGTSVIYISHRLDDVLSIADSVSVLRDGEVVITAPAASLSAADMMVHMSGQAQPPPRDITVNPSAASLALEVDGITTSDLPHAVSFGCHNAEILGIAGLAGSGRSELLQALFGLVPLRGGNVSRHRADDRITIGSAGQAVKAGLGYLGEDRQSMGLFAGQSVLNNMMVPGESAKMSKLSLIDRVRESGAAADLISKLGIKCNGPQQDISQLSGGNQQKALIGRWLHCDADILLLDEPTRGVDVATKGAIYRLLSELRDRRKTILLVSSELEELTALCDRILVLSDRKIVRLFARGEWSEADILAAAFQELANKTTDTFRLATSATVERRP